MPEYIPVNNMRCKTCGDVLLSLHVHDFKACSCDNFIDGGFDYVRRGGNFSDMETLPLFWKKEVQK